MYQVGGLQDLTAQKVCAQPAYVQTLWLCVQGAEIFRSSYVITL